MNELVKVVNQDVVTDSLTIAEGSGNEHKAVIQLIRTYISDLEEFGRVEFQMAPFKTAGGTQKREVAFLNERQATLLLTYMRNTESIREFKKKLVKAFFLMAEKLKNPADQPYQLPTNFKEALLQLVDQVEQNEKLQITVTEQAPKVAALDRISLAEGTHCVTNAAKILQVRPKDLFDFLSFNRWTYKRAGNKSWTAYQDKIQQGLLTHKVTTVTDMYTGKEKIIEQVLVTAKGIATLSKKLQEEVAA